MVEDAPDTLGSLCPSCKTHFESVRRYLDVVGAGYELSPRLVRGLDYYTRTTFEVVHSGLGAQNAVAGGGRFDGLVEEFGGMPTPAVGFAAGVDRIALIMNRGEEERDRGRGVPLVYVATAGKEYLKKGVSLLNDLRSSGLSAEIDYEGRSLKSQFRAADKLGVKFVIILGQEGLILRDMKKGEQEEVKREEIIDGVKSCLTA